MELLVDEPFHQAEEVTFHRNIPRVNQCEAVEEYGEGEEEGVGNYCAFLQHIGCIF